MNEQTMRPTDGFPRLSPFLLLTDLYRTPGTADAIAASLTEASPAAGRAFSLHLAYERGEFEACDRLVPTLLDEHADFLATLSTASLLARAAMWRGDVELWRQARGHMYSAPCATDKDRLILDFWMAVNDSALHDTSAFPDWFRQGRFAFLPADALPAARLFYVKGLFIAAHDLACGRITLPDVEGLGLMRTMSHFIEPMLAQATIEGTVLPRIHLHMMAATTYHNLGRDDLAVPHLDQAIALCLPDRLYSPVLEYRSLLDNLLDDRLAACDSRLLARVRELHARLSASWYKLHNTLLDRNISTTLTIREREVAKLAAYGLSNAEIALRLHIEVSSVKRFIFAAMNKVGAEKRGQLGLYV